MTIETGLGKGLDALIPGGDFIPEVSPPPTAGNEILDIPIDQIAPNPRQPRSPIDRFERFRVSLVRDDGTLVLHADRMVRDSNNDLRLSVNTSILPDGKYLIRVDGYAAKVVASGIKADFREV